ncbi:MAG: VCBS repeat-containing protein [Deltaproteobacteria bacterium]|nr:VCBS repeat-containing protein [Deltaproteobacteria bacterium]
MLEGFDDTGKAFFLLAGGRVIRVPRRCAPRQRPLEIRTSDCTVFRVGDLDRDGTDDVAVVSSGEHSQVRLVSGARKGQTLATLRDDHPRFGTIVAAAGDVNGDGWLDLLVTRPSACDCCDCSDSSDELLLYLGQQEAGQRLAMTLKGPDGIWNWIRALGVGDVDGDGRADVVVAHGHQIRLHRGRRAGIAPTGELVHRRATGMDGIAIGALGDSDGNGLAEWWWLDSDSGEAYVVRSQGAQGKKNSPTRLGFGRPAP